ncbi:MAG TPA: hypothetical protein VGR84_18660 [Candidatus Acidoferrales bacterium]|nr:hypothetical protein [Candidatus Acidoferrales bacterium]
MICYFLTTNLRAAEKEAAELGWQRVAMTRWASGRDDMRIVSRIDEFINMPGGNKIMPSRDIAGVDPDVNRHPWSYRELVMLGVAEWIDNPLLGKEGTKKLIAGMRAPTPLLPVEPPRSVAPVSESERLRRAGLVDPDNPPPPVEKPPPDYSAAMPVAPPVLDKEALERQELVDRAKELGLRIWKGWSTERIRQAVEGATRR